MVTLKGCDYKDLKMKRVQEKFQELKNKYPAKISSDRYGDAVERGKFYFTTDGQIAYFLEKFDYDCHFIVNGERVKNPELYNFAVEPRCALSLLPTAQESLKFGSLSRYVHTMRLILEFGWVSDFFNISEIVKFPEKPDMLAPNKTIWQRLDIGPDGKVLGFLFF